MVPVFVPVGIALAGCASSRGFDRGALSDALAPATQVTEGGLAGGLAGHPLGPADRGQISECSRALLADYQSMYLLSRTPSWIGWVSTYLSSVHFRSGGANHAGIEIVLDGSELFLSAIGDGDGSTEHREHNCEVNPDLGREQTAFARRGNSIKVLILSFVDLTPLPDDVWLVTCAVEVNRFAAAGECEIRLLEQGGADSVGN